MVIDISSTSSQSAPGSNPADALPPLIAIYPARYLVVPVSGIARLPSRVLVWVDTLAAHGCDATPG